DPRDVPAGLARRVAAERLEAGPHPAALAPATPRDRLRPRVADVGKDLRRDHEVAVQLVPLRDRDARAELLAPPEPLRPEPVRGGLVLHEHASRARDLIPRGREPVADPER